MFYFINASYLNCMAYFVRLLTLFIISIKTYITQYLACIFALYLLAAPLALPSSLLYVQRPVQLFQRTIGLPASKIIIHQLPFWKAFFRQVAPLVPNPKAPENSINDGPKRMFASSLVGQYFFYNFSLRVKESLVLRLHKPRI